MKRLMLVALFGACGRRALPDELQARCAAFADRVVACAFDPSITPPMSDQEQKSVRGIAYAVCTKTTDDPAALHYYGDVDHKIECMQGKDCDGVRSCLTADDPVGSAVRRGDLR
jgi:hypothetical protein